ncbi:glutathione hydrolase 1 proenzyme-like [Corticium candelabrum]|uniref:glutathione hydrolase 1 proenzyme-like n=1 Tax=Corticium candelabrum TaxID=121492 RepID=UPI002E2560E9|nr:glutathione hydrolase 1 proenzyme-like [Corticium candelabrum]
METREDVTRLIDEDNDNEVSEREANVVVALEEENLLLKEKKRRKKPSGLTVVIAGGVVFMIGVGIGLVVDILVGLPERDYHGAVAADSENCSLIGTDMIKRGGSAVDSAIAVLLCIGVIHGQSSGLGGGGFMIVRDAKGNAEAFDFRTTAPAAASPDMFRDNRHLALAGGLAVAVPGELKVMSEAHKKYGKLPWRDLFQPSIILARDGFTVNRALAHAINISFDKFLSPRMKEVYGRNGFPLQEDDTVYRKQLAKTLFTLANNSSSFYDGDIANSIIEEISDGGGIMTLDDLKNYTVNIQPPLEGRFRGSTVLGVPPPGSGAVLISILNIMDGYNDITNDATTYHRLVESFKFAYAQRSHLGDPFDQSVRDEVEQLIINMTSPAVADELRSLITPNETHDPSYYGHAFDLEEIPGTTHVSVYGPDGDAVAVTSSVNTYFGAKLMTRTGIVLNNDMDDFSSPNITNYFGLPPAKNNFIIPGKRPQSSQSPTIIISKKPNSKKDYVRLIVGAAGGTMITTSTAQVILYALGMGESVTAAVERRRIHNQLIPDRTLIEDGFSDNIKCQLIEMHHNVEPANSTIAVVQAVMATYPSDAAYRSDADIQLSAQSDSRKGGNASVV